MATRKITITLPEARVAEIRGLVRSGQASSIPAFVKHAVGVTLADSAGWKEMLDEALRETGGPLTRSEREWADAVLDSAR